MEQIILNILEALRRGETVDDKALVKLIHAEARREGADKRDLAKRRLLPFYQRVKRGWNVDAELERQLLQVLRMKPRRTASGVATITVITKPWPCSGDCLFCPNDLRMPKSYLHAEPACARAEQNCFDPYLQVSARLTALSQMGHATDKIELIVLGGTWSDYPEGYQTWFMSELFRALNDDAVAGVAANPMLASLKGKRFVTMAESNQYGKLDEETIKQLTGGEEIKARNLYEATTTFLPQFTLWLSCNDLPSVNDKSLFASDRVRVVEFNRHFSEDEQDKNLKSEFQTQEAMRGIFTWLLEGYFKYKRFGLKMSPAMRQVVKQYEKDNDLALQFLEEKCEKAEGAYTRAKTLYDAYKIWCKSNADMEAHPEWHGGKTVYSGYPTYRDIRMKGTV